MLGNSDIKFEYRHWGIKALGGAIRKCLGAASTCQHNVGSFALSQLRKAECQRGIGKHTSYDNVFAGQQSHAYEGSGSGGGTQGSLV